MDNQKKLSTTEVKPKKLAISKMVAALDKDWSLKVRTRDSYICQKCGCSSPKVTAAHVFSRNCWNLRWEVGNGITMCCYCHIHWGHREPVEFTLWVINICKNFEQYVEIYRNQYILSRAKRKAFIREQYQNLIEGKL